MALMKKFSVEEEMRRNPEFKKSDLEILRDWHKKQPHLPPMSDFELVLFLHSNYYRIEPTKTTIDIFFTIRSHVPELFSGRDPVGSKDLQKIIKVSCCVALPSTTPEGYKVIYGRLQDYEPSHYVVADAAKHVCMIIELWLNTAESFSPGQIIILDMEGAVFGHVARMNPIIIKKILYYVQEALPLRLKSIHVINTTPFVDLLLNIAKPFMKKELMDIIFFHNSPATLSKTFPIDIMPNEQGGKAGPFKDLWADQLKELEKHRDWFLAEDKRRVNEAARPGKAKSATDFFGVEGSFKTLNID